MCQPLPLGRCVTGAKTELGKATIELSDALQGQRNTKREYEAGAAKYSELFNQAEGDEPELEQFWNDAEAAMQKMSDANMRVMKAQNEVKQKRVLVDSTDTGLKELRENKNAEDRSIRIRTAEEQRAWTARVRKESQIAPSGAKISAIESSSRKAVLYSRMLQEENANYDSAQELERRYSGSATSLSESIAEMETKELDRKDEQIETLAQIRNEDIKKAKLYSYQMAMYATRIKDLTSALEEADKPAKSLASSHA